MIFINVHHWSTGTNNKHFFLRRPTFLALVCREMKEGVSKAFLGLNHDYNFTRESFSQKILLDKQINVISEENEVLKSSDFVLHLYFLWKRYLVRRCLYAVFIDIWIPLGERTNIHVHITPFFSLSPLQLQEVCS